jgi:hypothetical protein
MSGKPAAAAARPMLVEAPAAVSCWFWGSKETTTLHIGSLELEVKKDTPAREAFQMAAGLMQGGVEAWQEYALRRASAYVERWSLAQELPAETDEKIALFRSMRRGRFEQLYEAIAKHEAAHVRHVYKGKSYTEAEWSTIAPAPKGADGKPIKWADLLVYIEPDISLEADAWFVTEDAGVTLQLPDDQWVRIKSELTQGEHIQLVSSTKDSKDGVSAAGWVGARKLSFYIQDWSLTYPDGRKAPVGLDSIAELDAAKFAVLNFTVDAYERKLKEGREASPTLAQ